MKSLYKRNRRNPEEWIAQSPVPTPEDMELRVGRVWNRVKSAIDDPSPQPVILLPNGSRSRRLALVLIAAAMLATLVSLAVVLGPEPRAVSPALVETTGAGLFRMSSNQWQPIPQGSSIQFAETIRSDIGIGAVFVLADGSRVEMRPNSRLALQRAKDGLRITLDNGSVIVNAAKQRTGHLYVQTKDVTVSVVGTVFLVNAEQAGSRVAVIEGEVQVRQGASLKKLSPGEQLATNPLMASHPVTEEIAWSPSASAHVAVLEREQSSAPRMEFEAAIVKPVAVGGAFPNLACKGVDGAFSIPRIAAAFGGGGFDASAIPQGRCAGVAFLREFLATAYDIRADRISGDPPAMYELEAKAEDPGTATKDQLRRMFQNFVIDQFKIKAHRETGEEDGYILQVAKGGLKLKEASGDEEPPHFSRRPGASVALDQGLAMTVECKCSMKMFANYLSGLIGGAPVIDKTDLTGMYDIRLMLNRLPSAGGPRGASGSGNVYDPPIRDAVEDQLGLRLQPAKTPVEYLVVDHIEKPTEN